MLIDSEVLKTRLRSLADSEWDGAYDTAAPGVTAYARNVLALEEELRKATAPCEDRIQHGGKIFTCREKGYHKIHDDHEQTDGTPMRWLDTSKGRLKEGGRS